MARSGSYFPFKRPGGSKAGSGLWSPGDGGGAEPVQDDAQPLQPQGGWGGHLQRGQPPGGTRRPGCGALLPRISTAKTKSDVSWKWKKNPQLNLYQRLHRGHADHGERHAGLWSQEAGALPLLVHWGGQQEPGHVPHQVSQYILLSSLIISPQMVPHSYDCSRAQQHEGDGDLAGEWG